MVLLCVLLFVSRVTVVMLPDTELGAKIESDERQKLDGIRASLSEQQVGGGLYVCLLGVSTGLCAQTGIAI